MLERRLGKTELVVSIADFRGTKLPIVDENTTTKALNRALDLRINFVNIARGHDDGEEKIGSAISRRRDEFHISTKARL